MTDELSISYSHVSSPAAPGLGASAFASPEPELVAFADCEIIPLDSQRTLVINRLNGKQQFFAPGVVEAATELKKLKGRKQFSLLDLLVFSMRGHGPRRMLRH